MSATEVNAIVDNVFEWLLFVFFLLLLLGAFDRRD